MGARLTYQDPDGSWGIRGVDLGTLPPKVYGALCKLRDLERLLEEASRPGDDDITRTLAREELDRLMGRPESYGKK